MPSIRDIAGSWLIQVHGQKKDAHTTTPTKSECGDSMSCRRDHVVTSSDSAAFSTLKDAQRLCHAYGTSPATGLFRFTGRKKYQLDYAHRRVDVEILIVAVEIYDLNTHKFRLEQK
jgi:hypothetical protein